MQPRGVNGASASKTSLIDPMHASSRCGTNPSSARRAPSTSSGIHLQPRVDERTDQPAPHRALVIGRVARAQVAEVARLVVGVAGRERAQADRRQQPIAHDAHHRLPAVARQHRMRQRDREHLVRPALRIVARAPVGVDDVVAGSRRPAYQKRSLNDRRARSARSRYSRARVVRARRPSCSISRSALYQSALISTALPRRGVTTQSSTFASIHVS